MHPRLVIDEADFQKTRARLHAVKRLLRGGNKTPHMLRHTCATNMVMAGMDAVTVKAQMGHKDIRTTLNIYTHVTADHQQTEVSKLDAFLASRSIG